KVTCGRDAARVHGRPRRVRLLAPSQRVIGPDSMVRQDAQLTPVMRSCGRALRPWSRMRNSHPRLVAPVRVTESTSSCPPHAAAIEKKHAVVGVIGLGYVGLPLIEAFVSAGYRTIGYDVDARKVDRLARGESYIGHIESSRIADWTARGQFEPTADMGRLGEA